MNMLVNIKREVQASELDFIEVEKLILQCEKAKSSIKVIYESIKERWSHMFEQLKAYL